MFMECKFYGVNMLFTKINLSYKISRVLLYLPAVSILVSMALPSIAMGWEPLTIDGFGNANNNGVSCMVISNSVLLVGTENVKTGCEFFQVTSEGQWSKLSGDGLGEPANTQISSLIHFRKGIYTGTKNTITGAKLYKSTDNGNTWNKIEVAALGTDNYRISSMEVFKNKLFLGIRNPVGAKIIVSPDGITFTLSVPRGFTNPHNIDILSMLSVRDNVLFAGSENADIMTGKTSGPLVYATYDGETWESCQGFAGMGTRFARTSSLLATDSHQAIWVGCRSLLPGRMDQGIFYKGLFENGKIEFVSKDFGHDKLPGITCMVEMNNYIIAGCSGSRLLKIGGGGTISEVVLPEEISRHSGSISGLVYHESYLYAGVTFPTFPTRGAALYRTQNIQTEEFKSFVEKNVISTLPDKTETRSTGRSLLAIGGIILIIFLVAHLISKISKQ